MSVRVDALEEAAFKLSVPELADLHTRVARLRARALMEDPEYLARYRAGMTAAIKEASSVSMSP